MGSGAWRAVVARSILLRDINGQNRRWAGNNVSPQASCYAEAEADRLGFRGWVWVVFNRERQGILTDRLRGPSARTMCWRPNLRSPPPHIMHGITPGGGGWE